jgi:RNA polymerase sigma-70 factor (ECF subfamily)
MELQREQRAETDRTAEFVRLLRQHDVRLTAYVHALVPGWNDAQDVLQETSVRLWQQFDQYTPGTNFGAWACTVARYMVLAYRERSGRERLCFSQSVMDKIGAEVRRATEEHGDDRRRLLADCLTELSDSNRELLKSCYTDRTKIKDVAARLGRSTNAVYLALSRVRRCLHECIERKLSDQQA